VRELSVSFNFNNKTIWQFAIAVSAQQKSNNDTPQPRDLLFLPEQPT
jgi:hypothetical protein